MSENNDDWGFSTKAIRTGYKPSAEGEHSEAMFLTSSFVFDSAAHAAARFSGDEPGNIYSRFTNPTVNTFEQRLAAMEGGEVCVATASGMSAIMSTCMAVMQQGDHLISSRSIFGTTSVMFSKYLARFGIETSFVDLTDLNAWREAIRPETRMLFLETPSNPLTDVGDIQALSKLAHEHDCVLVVDNCFCTPVLQQPLDLGADVVIHSATKYLDGQGRCIGGAVIGDKKLVGEDVYGVLRTTGPTLSAFNAWVFLKGLETLEIRMQAHSASCQILAEWLDAHPNVEKVNYPGLASHPQYELAKQQQRLAGGLLSFEVKGGREGAWKVMDQTRLLSITANLGDAKTTITHPASTTHGRLSEEEKANAGITEGLVRIAVGLENIKDIQADLARGLDG